VFFEDFEIAVTGGVRIAENTERRPTLCQYCVDTQGYVHPFHSILLQNDDAIIVLNFFYKKMI
jgi:hypothetical protein